MRSRRMEDERALSTPGTASSPSDVFDGADDGVERARRGLRAEYRAVIRAVRKFQHVCKI